MKNIDRNVKLSVMDIIMDFISTPFRMANNGVDVNDIDLDPNSSDKTKAYLAKNLEQLENEKEIGNENTQTIENEGRIPGIRVDSRTLGSTTKVQQTPSRQKNKDERVHD